MGLGQRVWRDVEAKGAGQGNQRKAQAAIGLGLAHRSHEAVGGGKSGGGAGTRPPSSRCGPGFSERSERAHKEVREPPHSLCQNQPPQTDWGDIQQGQLRLRGSGAVSSAAHSYTLGQGQSLGLQTASPQETAPL